MQQPAVCCAIQGRKAGGNRANRSIRALRTLLGLAAPLLCLSCPLNLPERVQLKGSPAMYMPIGSPDLLADQLKGLTNGLGGLTSLNITGNGSTAIYDYRGPEYGDTRVVMAVMKDLVSPTDFSSVASGLDAVPVIPPGGYSVTGLTNPSGTGTDIDLSNLLGSSGVLKDYPGLEFRSVLAYLYISGPATVLEKSTIDLEFQDGTGGTLTGIGFDDRRIAPMTLPNLPPAPGTITATLAKSEMVFDLKGIFNASPPPDSLKAKLDFTMGTITIYSLDELRAFAAELQTPLTAHLVLLLPFQFTASNPVPVFAGPDPGAPPPANSPPNPALELISGGGDLLGRDESGDGTMDDIMEHLQSLVMEVSIVNNLGINGDVVMLPAMPTTAYNPAVDPAAAGLGTIALSGKSTITVPRDKLEQIPFSPALEIYLKGDFDIKRTLPPEGAMTMNLGITLRTNIDITF